MPTPHDELFQFTFGHTHHAASWVKSILPARLAAAFDANSLQPLRERFPGVRVRPHMADGGYVASFHLGPQTVEVLLPFEHKSYDDPGLRAQLLRYSVHLQRSLQRARNDLPIVLPIVLQHGRPRGRPHGDLRDGLHEDLRENLQEGRGTPADSPEPDPAEDPLTTLRGMQPSQQIVVDDLDTVSEEQIVERGLTPLATATLLCLRTLPHTTAEDVPAVLWRWQHLLRAVDRASAPPEAPPLGEDAIDAIGWYVLSVTEVESLRLAEILAEILSRDVPSIMSTIERTYQKGLAAGKAEGKAEGKASTLLRQITRRFGAPEAAVVERVDGATPAELDCWTDRILDATSLDELFAD